MDDNFIHYLQRLELMAFFSGYPLLYSFVIFLEENMKFKFSLQNKMISLLPYAYALVGTLYLGLQLKNLYPDYSIDNIRLCFQQPWLAAWAFLSLFFWIPFIAKKRVLSLLHSLLFFFFLLKDLFLQLTGSTGDLNLIRNDMNIFTVSLLLNLGAFVFIIIVYSLYIKSKRPGKPAK